MKKILFIYPVDSTFVRSDREVLETSYQVYSLCISSSKNIAVFLLQYVWFFCKLLYYIPQVSSVYIWFADYHSALTIFISKIFRRKTFLVLGGYDIARIRKLNYGALGSPFRAWCVKVSVNNATMNLPVSSYIYRKAKWIFPKGKYRVVYNAIKKNPLRIGEERLGILTVAKVDSRRDYYIKGIDRFVYAARELPLCQFTIIGLAREIVDTMDKVPNNLKIMPSTSQEELFHVMVTSSIYCQLSRIESFGLAAVEAMNFGCIPIVFNAGALPEIVGSFGAVCNTNEEVVSSITSALEIPESMRNNIQHYVINTFSMEKRARLLFEIIQ